MKGLTHIAGAAAAGLTYATAAHLSIPNAIIVTAGSMVATLIPDIDICTSKLGRRIAPASLAIQIFIGHRTMFHAPLLYLVTLWFLAVRFPSFHLLIVAGAIGTASHLFLDLLNPTGIPLLWPLPKRFRLASIRSGGILDWVTGSVLTAAGLAAYLYFCSF